MLKMKSNQLIWLTLLILVVATNAKAQRWIRPTDVYRLQNIGSPKISPEGNWILYSHTTVDSAKDKYQSKLFMEMIFAFL